MDLQDLNERGKHGTDYAKENTMEHNKSIGIIGNERKQGVSG